MKNLLVVGCLFALAGAYVYVQRRRVKVPVYYRKKLFGNYNARTIAPFGIFIKESEKDNAALLAHETIHWQQFQQMGLLNFYTSYIKQLATKGYDAAPLEQAARVTESDYCKQNYTECVRTGQANTIYNPDFRK